MTQPITATNPETGEKVEWNGTAWVPMQAGQRMTGDPLMESTTRTFLNNVMATPSATGDLLAGGAALAQTGAESLFTNPEQGFVERLGQNYEAQTQQFPANMLRAIPRPTVSDVTSAARSIPALMPGGETPQEAFARNSQAAQERLAQLREQNPNAVQTGEVLADIATLGLGRQPFAKRLVNRSSRIPSIADEAVQESLKTISSRRPDIAPAINELITSGTLQDPGVNRLYRRILDSGPVASVMRGLGKAGEASLEGALMGALKENDPLLNAGLAGGTQMGMSMAATLLGMPKSLTDLAVKAAGFTAFFRLLQEFGPNENDLYTAADSTFNKLATGLTIGVASQMLGGRIRGSGAMGQRLAEDLPRFTDAINTIPRGAMLSIANQIQTERANGENLTELTLQTLSTNPGAFPEAIRNRLGRAMENNQLAEEIRRMRDLSDFTDVLDARNQ